MMSRRSNGGANLTWSAAIKLQRESSSNEQPVASCRMSLFVEYQCSNEVLFRQKLCQDISPLLVDKYLSV